MNGGTMNVTVRQLRAFAILAGVGSFTRAAAALHTTQPALSAQIRELETALGVRLFDRNTRSVAMTVTARELLPVVDRILADVTGVIAHARDVAARNIGKVAVAALPSIAATLLPQTVGRFCAAHRGIVVALHDALADRVAEMVRDEVVDFGISGAVGGEASLVFEPLGTDRMVAVLPPGHALTRKPRIELVDLLDTALILMDRESSVRHIVDLACAARGRVAAPVYEAAFMATAVGMVRAGLGATLLPSSAFELNLLADLMIRPVDEPLLERRLGIVRRAGRSLSPAADLFATALRADLIAWLTRRPPKRRQAATPRRIDRVRRSA
jgi:LysR family carnitine catabolism transcriptional activator